MHLTADREGKVKEEHSMQDRLLECLYGHAAGRVLLRMLVSPVVSGLGGRILDSRLSALFVPLFIRCHSVEMAEYEQKKYSSFNDFFKRKLAVGARPVNPVEDVFVSPCDGRLSVCRISDGCGFFVKDTKYTVESLLKNKKLAAKYAGGYAWIFRLCVDDCHRYIYVDDGMVSAGHKIPGVFHTVNPAANDVYPIYKENTREYCLLKSANFGTVLQMEVGALLVGKIENRLGKKEVARGEEKGNFAFGGSTVVLLTQKGRVLPNGDILRHSRSGIETKVKLGEMVGRRQFR